MIFIGIDAAKDKHDCFIISSDGEVLLDIFTISKALMTYLVKIKSVTIEFDKTPNAYFNYMRLVYL